MSQSFAHDDPRRPQDISSAGGSLDEQLADEIADHLAAAASDLVRRGESEDQAARSALARFGDVARVTRQCWWIHKREEVMLRVATLAVLVVLTAGVAVVGLGGWQLQRNLASRTEELSEQLATLSATQKAMLDQQRPPEISGVAYLGDKSHPAKDAEIQIYKFSEEPRDESTLRTAGVVTRRIRTDASGRFNSGIVQSGEYCLLGPLMGPDGELNEQERIFTQLQSRPLYLVPGVGKSTVDLDLAASAQIRLEVSGIPSSFNIGGEVIQIALAMMLYPDRIRFYPQGPVPPSAEPPRDGWPLPLPPLQLNTAVASAKAADLPMRWFLPPRAYSVVVQLSPYIKRAIGTDGGMGGGAMGMGGGMLPVTPIKAMPIELKLTPGDLATIAVSVVGDPLQARADAAVKDYETKRVKLLGVADQLVLNVLPILAKEIELKVDVTTTKTNE